MPEYSYECATCGHATDWFGFTMDRPNTVKCEECGKTAQFSIAAMYRPRERHHKTNPFADGHRSSAMAVMPDEAEAEQTRLRSHQGCAGVEVDKNTGQVITHSKSERDACMRANRDVHGRPMVDFNAFY